MSTGVMKASYCVSASGYSARRRLGLLGSLFRYFHAKRAGTSDRGDNAGVEEIVKSKMAAIGVCRARSKLTKAILMTLDWRS